MLQYAFMWRAVQATGKMLKLFTFSRILQGCHLLSLRLQVRKGPELCGTYLWPSTEHPWNSSLAPDSNITRLMRPCCILPSIAYREDLPKTTSRRRFSMHKE